MKRFISILISVIIALYPAAPFVYAENNKYTATDNDFVSPAQYSTREVAISHFIHAVGIERFSSSDTILNKFLDKSKVSLSCIDEMSAAVFSGLINGYEDNTLRPQSPITRAEALVILNRALTHTELVPRYDISFSDTPIWAEKQINRLACAGIVKGYGDGTLGAYDYMTVEQVKALCDRIIRASGPAGDYYTYINSDWLASAELLDDTPVYSAMTNMAHLTTERITDIIFSLYRRYYNNGERFASGSAEKRIIDVYSAAANQGYRDKIGLSPISDYLLQIDKIDSFYSLISVMSAMETDGFPTLLSVKLDTNIYKSSQYLPSVSCGYTGIGASVSSDSYSMAHLNAYKKYLETLFEISGHSKSDAQRLAEDASEICDRLTTKKDDSKSDIASRISVIDKAQFAKMFDEFNAYSYLEKLGFGSCDKVLVHDIELVSFINYLLRAENLPSIKAYLKASVLTNSAPYLSSQTFEAYQEYQNALNGTSLCNIPSDYAVDIVQELLGWEVGKIYIDEHFPDTAKAAAQRLTKDIVEEYEKLISSCTRMTPQTRTHAIKKLRAIKINAAYPENIYEYFIDSSCIRPISDGGNLMEYKINISRRHSEYCKELISSGASADLGGWTIYPQTVNAMYNPVANSITIPAAMLQAPFFETGASYEENLGGIGVVIAHEISHAFDSTGAQFDENGNLFNWWTRQDYYGFNLICQKVEEEYNKLSVPAGKVDGNLTMDENIADLAGMSCVIRLAEKKGLRLDPVFRSYAKSWRTKTSPDYEKFMLSADVHSPAKIRVNRVLSNFQEFYNCYGVIEGDGMFIEKGNRINVW